jgi:hypothetical protein
MQFRSHQASHNRWITFHELPRRGLIRSLKDGDAKGLFSGFHRSAGQDQFARFDCVLEPRAKWRLNAMLSSFVQFASF